MMLEHCITAGLAAVVALVIGIPAVWLATKYVVKHPRQREYDRYRWREFEGEIVKYDAEQDEWKEIP